MAESPHSSKGPIRVSHLRAHRLDCPVVSLHLLAKWPPTADGTSMSKEGNLLMGWGTGRITRNRAQKGPVPSLCDLFFPLSPVRREGRWCPSPRSGCVCLDKPLLLPGLPLLHNRRTGFKVLLPSLCLSLPLGFWSHWEATAGLAQPFNGGLPRACPRPSPQVGQRRLSGMAGRFTASSSRPSGGWRPSRDFPLPQLSAGVKGSPGPEPWASRCLPIS